MLRVFLALRLQTYDESMTAAIALVKLADPDKPSHTDAGAAADIASRDRHKDSPQ
jgi:hypothetical protein